MLALATLVLLALCASAQANARLNNLLHGFPCNGVNPRDEFQVCQYRGANETMFQMLRAARVSGPLVGTGLNGTDNFVVSWLSSYGGVRATLMGGDGKKLKDLELPGREGDFHPSVAPLSHRGFALAFTDRNGDIMAGTFTNDGEPLMQFAPAELKNIVTPPKVVGLSEERYVALATDNLDQLWASVWYKNEFIANFKVSADVREFSAVALSGDSYVIMVTDSTGGVRLLAYRVNSQEIYTLENAEANGEITGSSDAVSLAALNDNHFAIVVTQTPNVKLYVYRFKDALRLRPNNNNNEDVRVASPQAAVGQVQATDVATPASVAWRDDGFVITYGTTSQELKAIALKRKGIANGTEVVVTKGPIDIEHGGFAAPTTNGGFATAWRGQNGNGDIKFFRPVDFGERAATTTTTTTEGRKRQATATAAAAAASTAAPTSTSTVAPSQTMAPVSEEETEADTEVDIAGPASGTESETMMEQMAGEPLEGAVMAPVLFTLSNKNVVALWLTSEMQADADAYVGYNGHVTVYQPDGTVVAANTVVVDDGSIMKLADGGCEGCARSGAAALVLQLAAALVGAVALLF